MKRIDFSGLPPYPIFHAREGPLVKVNNKTKSNYQAGDETLIFLSKDFWLFCHKSGEFFRSKNSRKLKVDIFLYLLKSLKKVTPSMGCHYDIYIEFLANTVLQICIIFALLYNKNVLVCGLMEFLILDFEGHSTIYCTYYPNHCSFADSTFWCTDG